MKCINCNEETSNKKFCSRSCAASTNNKVPKRKLKTICSILGCSSIVKSYRHTKCATHFAEFKENQYKNKSLAEYRNKESVKNKHPSWKHAHIRALAKSQHKALLTLPCANCGYDKHVELCHIKAISTFPDTALVREVNDATNIIQLCPNCHWEFDNLPR